jgi:EAL domain-containing protein (putative c-di-GMP-specific phosphodiesterase class I)
VEFLSASNRIRPHDLGVAIAANQFDLLYQPVIELSTRRIGKAQALVRWRHPELGDLGADRFIALAECSGWIGPVGEWILHRALRDLRSLQADHPDFAMSVNVSPMQIQSGKFSQAAMGQALAAHGVAASSLTIEISERIALQGNETHRKRLAGVRAAGVRLAIDDFGMGNSTLTSLVYFPCDFIKLDRQFVSAASTAPTRRAIARLIVDMAHVLGMQVIGEGVETENDLAHAVSLGCDHAQGDYWGRPLTLEALRSALNGGGCAPTSSAGASPLPAPAA